MPGLSAFWEQSVGFRRVCTGQPQPGAGWALWSDVQGAHNGEAGVPAVAAVIVGAGAGVAGGRRGRARQRVGEHQWGGGRGLALPRCASEGAEQLGLAREGPPGTARLIFLGNQDKAF